MKFMVKFKHWLDKGSESFALILLTLMVIIITLQVFTRYFFSYTPSWSEELARIFMVWFGFLGIAIGFRDKLHISIEFIVRKFPVPVQKGLDFISKLLVILVGVFFVYQGMRFTILMTTSTMPGTKLPNSVLYGVVPITGILMILYGFVSLFEKGDIGRYGEQKEEQI